MKREAVAELHQSSKNAVAELHQSSKNGLSKASVC
jgi:hypothetical protein